MSKIGLFIFRRDLRIEDNIGLAAATHECDKVYCLFILEPKQISKKLNPYFSANALAFMVESLIELRSIIPLVVLHGDTIQTIKRMIQQHKITDLYINLDYTAYSQLRDYNIQQLCLAQQIKCHLHHDICLNPPGTFKYYKVFTPYHNVAKQTRVKPEIVADQKKIAALKETQVNLSKLLASIKNTSPERQHGGRKLALQTLKQFRPASYEANRDLPANQTSRLSPYLKFGVLGAREVYRAVSNSKFRAELYWRDFYLQVAYYSPNVLVDGSSSRVDGSSSRVDGSSSRVDESSGVKRNADREAPTDTELLPKISISYEAPKFKTGKYNISKNFRPMPIEWHDNEKLFQAWCDGKTGIPLVDAAMRQLKQTGYMHNRCRMVVASVLTKLFHIDWRLGERYFANWLTDYDPASNNGGWQWASGTGADAQPYYRIFNPYTQAVDHDPECQYIKKWLPELANLTPKEIFAMRSSLFNYDLERKKAISIFSK